MLLFLLEAQDSKEAFHTSSFFYSAVTVDIVSKYKVGDKISYTGNALSYINVKNYRMSSSLYIKANIFL